MRRRYRARLRHDPAGDRQSEPVSTAPAAFGSRQKRSVACLSATSENPGPSSLTLTIAVPVAGSWRIAISTRARANLSALCATQSVARQPRLARAVDNDRGRRRDVDRHRALTRERVQVGGDGMNDLAEARLPPGSPPRAFSARFLGKDLRVVSASSRPTCGDRVQGALVLFRLARPPQRLVKRARSPRVAAALVVQDVLAGEAAFACERVLKRSSMRLKVATSEARRSSWVGSTVRRCEVVGLDGGGEFGERAQMAVGRAPRPGFRRSARSDDQQVSERERHRELSVDGRDDRVRRSLPRAGDARWRSCRRRTRTSATSCAAA